MMRSAPPSSPPLDAACVPWLLAAALATAGPHAPHQPLWLVLLAGAALLWRALLWRRRGALPARWLLPRKKQVLICLFAVTVLPIFMLSRLVCWWAKR